MRTEFNLLEVTQRDIDLGIPNSGLICPLGLALNRTFAFAHIDETGALLSRLHGDTRFFYRVDKHIVGFVRMFDNGYANLKPMFLKVDHKERLISEVYKHDNNGRRHI